MKVVKEIRVRKVNFMNMTFSKWDDLPCNPCKTMIVTISALFG